MKTLLCIVDGIRLVALMIVVIIFGAFSFTLLVVGRIIVGISNLFASVMKWLVEIGNGIAEPYRSEKKEVKTL